MYILRWNRNIRYSIHSLIQNVQFECCDFTTSLKNIVENDFVYLDPPYAPEKDTSFIKYTNKGFGLDEHKKLFTLCNNLSNENDLCRNGVFRDSYLL